MGAGEKAEPPFLLILSLCRVSECSISTAYSYERVERTRKTRNYRFKFYTDHTSFIFVACRFGERADGSGHLRSSGGSSIPQSLSISVCSVNCFMPTLQSIPAIEMPSTTCQTTFSALPKAFRTSSFNGWSSDGITVIAPNAI